MYRGGVGATPALGGGPPTPTTRQSGAVATGGAVVAPTPDAAASAATPVPAASGSGTPPVPSSVPAAFARVRVGVTRYRLSAPTWAVAGTVPTVALRLDARRATAARVQLRVEDRSSRRVVLRQSLGVVRSGVDAAFGLTPRLAARPGRYRLRLIVRDQTGRRTEKARALEVVAANRTATAPDTTRGGAYVFPVQGACNFRTLEAQRFLSARGGGRAHNGQDIGTFQAYPPVVAVTAATVQSVLYDTAGGGWTIIFTGDDGVDYGYLHLKAGSIVVKPGDRVTPGQRVANAGNTGGDYEPHLHFEMRPAPWSAHRADAIDPMPLLSGLPNGCEG